MKSQLLKSISESNNNTYAEGGEMGGYKIRGYETEDYDNESDVDYVWGSKSDAINSARQHWESGDYDLIVVQMIEDEDEEQIIDPDPVFEITRSEGEYEFSKGGSTHQGGGEIEIEDGNLIIDNSEIKNLTYYRSYEEVEVVSDNDSGYVTIRYDEEQNDREYILINDTVYYLDDIEVYAKGGSTYAEGGEITIEGNPYKNQDFFIYRNGKEVVSWNADEIAEDEFSKETAQLMYDFYNKDKKELSKRLDKI